MSFEWEVELFRGPVYHQKALVTVLLNPDLGDSIVELVTDFGTYTAKLHDEPT